MKTTDNRSQVRHAPSAEVDLSSFIALGSLANLGATVLEGAPEAWVRIDFAEAGMSAGLFVASPGKVRYAFPSTEHATIVEGEATFTDEHGRSETYRPGDSYFITQGQMMICSCDVRVVKSFFNYTANSTTA
ncbi:MAG: hypothetical protein JWO88_2493 [Frankiales bacterium]|jgi:uncharacterized cupin superfamily protein|nr:hypothetical protein [Frankiales bacterium]